MNRSRVQRRQDLATRDTGPPAAERRIRSLLRTACATKRVSRQSAARCHPHGRICRSGARLVFRASAGADATPASIAESPPVGWPDQTAFETAVWRERLFTAGPTRMSVVDARRHAIPAVPGICRGLSPSPKSCELSLPPGRSDRVPRTHRCTRSIRSAEGTPVRSARTTCRPIAVRCIRRRCRAPRPFRSYPGRDANSSWRRISTAPIRLTLDIWERYLRRRVRWWHAGVLAARWNWFRIVHWPNAHSGPGFIETGAIVSQLHRPAQLLCLNFDVIAHETGHAILFSQIGVPPPGADIGLVPGVA